MEAFSIVLTAFKHKLQFREIKILERKKNAFFLISEAKHIWEKNFRLTSHQKTIPFTSLTPLRSTSQHRISPWPTRGDTTL